MTEILTKEYGIEVLHDRSVYDMIDGKLDRSYAYDMALGSVEQILADNPSIEMVIDDCVNIGLTQKNLVKSRGFGLVLYFLLENGNIEYREADKSML